MTTPTAKSSHRPPTPEALTEFILSLVQAFLRTGYYLPEHPRSKEAKVGLHQRFQKLFSGRHELTFILKEKGEVKDILIDGALPNTETLRSMMTQGMAEVYVPRLSKFFERKQLVSLTLKECMGSEEFSRFVDVMSEPSFVTLDAEAKDLFVAHLRDHGIRNISFLFTEDLVTPDRKLPWRAQLAISRLRKDLKVIPMLHHLDGEALHNLRLQVVRDVLRPITRPDLMAVILLNSDLAHTQGLTDQEIEDELVSYVPENLLLETARQALSQHLDADPDRSAHDDKRALAKLYSRLRSSELSGARELIREFFDKGLIDYETLPENLKKEIRIEQDTDRYLNRRVRILEALEVVTTAKRYRDFVSFFLPVFGELLRRHLLDEVVDLLKVFQKHASLEGSRGQIATEFLRQIGAGPSAARLKQMFLTGKKVDRVALTPMFQALGELAQPILLEIVRETENTWVRKNACEILLQIGGAALDLLLEEMRSGRLSNQSLAELLMVFEELGTKSPALLQTLKIYLRHLDPGIRAEAAWALCRLQGIAGEDAFLGLLSDSKLEVRKRAIRCLAHIKSKKGFTYFMKILRSSSKDDTLRPLKAQVYRSLAEFPGAMIEPGKETEQFLLDLLKECYPRGLRAMIHFHDHPRLDPESFWAVCETLATIGTGDSIEVLSDVQKQLKEPGREKLDRLMERIQTRHAKTELVGVP